MRLLLILIPLLLLAQSLRERQGRYVLAQHLRGEVRFGYIDTEENGFGVAGHLHYHHSLSKGIDLGITLEGARALWGESGQFFGDGEKGVVFVSELFALVQGEGFSLKLGRIAIPWTPHADSDDIRLVPNYFRGLYGEIGRNFRLLYLDRMAGWGSGGSIGTFKKFSQILDLPGSFDAIWALGLVEEEWQLWYYLFGGYGQSLYGSWEKEQGPWRFGVQFDMGGGAFDNKSFGGYGAVEFEGVQLYGAMSWELGSNLAPSFGGGPLYTSMELWSLDGIERPKRGEVVGVEIGGFGLMVGHFHGRGYTRELDWYWSGKILGVEVELLQAQSPGSNLFRCTIRYGF
ncbi:MAG: hypothetical protein C6I00_02320 [Nitratiruptor sp.]|nr:hypothetical protein [Nitratiruptor sp.]NPA84121.1 hypothetical protein [Campylobacterota bacterium]